jgi:hypothetical protein
VVSIFIGHGGITLRFCRSWSISPVPTSQTSANLRGVISVAQSLAVEQTRVNVRDADEMARTAAMFRSLEQWWRDRNGWRHRSSSRAHNPSCRSL